MNESFKKVSLHDIAKKYNKEIVCKTRIVEKDEQEKPVNINTDTVESNKKRKIKKK